MTRIECKINDCVKMCGQGNFVMACGVFLIFVGGFALLNEALDMTITRSGPCVKEWIMCRGLWFHLQCLQPGSG